VEQAREVGQRLAEMLVNAGAGSILEEVSRQRE
jgi:hypothetical protein